MVRSVLIVDDEPNIVRSLQFLMTKAGYDVRVARDGEQALNEIASAPPDLVLLDAMMPKRDGFDVCQRLRSDPATRHVPVVIISAMDDDDSRARATAAGATAYYTKPFSPIALLKEIERLKPPGASAT